MLSKKIKAVLFAGFMVQAGYGQQIDNYIPEIVASKSVLCKGETVTLTITRAALGAPIGPLHPLRLQDRVYRPNASLTCFYNSGLPYGIDVTPIMPQVSGDRVLIVNNNGSVCNPDFVITIKATPTVTTNYRIQWEAQHTYFSYPGVPDGYYQINKYDGNITITVIDLAKPSIKASKGLVLPGESSTLTASGCGNGSSYLWKNTCTASGWSVVGNPINVGQGSYLVKCVQNGCESEPSAPVNVLPETPSPNSLSCPNAQAQAIFNFTRNGDDGRLDYHQYNVETTICSTGVAGCSAETVWQKLKSSVWYNAPNTDDFSAVVGKKVTAIFSKALFTEPEKSVQNCGDVNLPLSTAAAIHQVNKGSIYASLYMMGKYPSSYASAVKSYAGNPNILPQAGNPIIQTIDEASKSITNYTQFGHILHPGRVVRTVVEECGVIKIKTVGVGRSWLADLGLGIGGLVMGASMGYVNAEMGQKLFQQVDLRLKASL